MADTYGALATAIYSKFQADSDLVAALGGSTGKDAYRMYNKRAKENPVFPYVVFMFPIGNTFDTLSEKGETINLQFNIYDYDEDSPDDDSTINDVYSKLDEVYGMDPSDASKGKLTISGYYHISTLRGVTNPIPTTDDTQQITVQYTVLIQES
jgi:hypothetical protein